MALTGELQNIPIVDIIQLVHTTRKSGIFSVTGDKGVSKIVFSSGYIVGANHINDSVRIGSVLVKMGAITVDGLKQALADTKNAGKDRRPLLSALVHAGKLKQDVALKGLKKLVEMTIIELMSWTKGTFTFDTEAFVYSSDSGGSSDELEQDVVLDAQMVLMDALRVYDERERDRASGKEVPSYEALYADVLPGERPAAAQADRSAITADVLGLADIDRLEKKIPRPAAEMAAFDPIEIHRQKIRELLADHSSKEQEAFVAFLRKYMDRKSVPDASAQQGGRAVVMFSRDKLVRHAVMTICKEQRLPVFTTDDENDLERIITRCLSAMRMPVVVFDSPAGPESGFPEGTIVLLRHRMRRKYSAVPILQLASPQDSAFVLRSYNDGVRAVLPKPVKGVSGESFVQETIRFLDTFTSYLNGFQYRSEATDRSLKELKKDIRALREIATPSDAALVMLAAVAEMFDRAITFIVRPAELTGERAIGVSSDKSMGPTPADRLKVPLAQPSLFRDVIEKGSAYFGESGDDALRALFQEIGGPFSPSVALIPLISERKVVAVVYGDFGKKEASPVQIEILEILAQQVGISLEYALFRRQAAKGAQKT